MYDFDFFVYHENLVTISGFSLQSILHLNLLHLFLNAFSL